MLTGEAAGEATEMSSDEQSDEICTWNSWGTQKLDDLLEWERVMLSPLFELLLFYCLQNAEVISNNGKKKFPLTLSGEFFGNIPIMSVNLILKKKCSQIV